MLLSSVVHFALYAGDENAASLVRVKIKNLPSLAVIRGERIHWQTGTVNELRIQWNGQNLLVNGLPATIPLDIKSSGLIEDQDLDGKIMQVNDAVVRIHGYDSKDDLIGRSAFALISERDRVRATENLMKTLSEGSISSVEYRFLTKNREEFDAELSASLLRDASGAPTGFIGTTRDVSERRRMQEALQQS